MHKVKGLVGLIEKSIDIHLNKVPVFPATLGGIIEIFLTGVAMGSDDARHQAYCERHAVWATESKLNG